ncbi:MAG: hypothetical protein VYE22_03010 [Myxococcota bacterium]|nr:hypothetical protein [Myxococcota bacterium]
MRTMLLAALLLGACGGSDAPAEEPMDDQVATTGDEVEADPEPAMEEPEPPPPTGPGQLRVNVTVGGQAAESATVRVMDEAGEVVAEGAPGDMFSVESGSYRVAASVTDASVLADTPTRELDGMATVTPGETAEVTVEFPVSRVLIEVRRRNRPVARWQLTVARENPGPGEEATEFQLEPSREHVPVTPGRYAGTLRFGGQQIEVNGLIFQGGARMTVPVNVD